MITTPEYAGVLAWFVWALSWFAAALWSGRTAKRAGFGVQLPYRIVTVIGAYMLFLPMVRRIPGPVSAYAHARLWTLSDAASWAMVGLIVVGFLFAWWARLHLGTLWSGFVTKKEGHHVVDTGPYAIVRHPIYTGIIFAAFAMAVQHGSPVGILGAVVMTIGFWMKAKLEEGFLKAELGAEAYDSYRRRVPMLLPFGPKAA